MEDGFDDFTLNVKTHYEDAPMPGSGRDGHDFSPCSVRTEGLRLVLLLRAHA
jgi:hypothetical protein